MAAITKTGKGVSVSFGTTPQASNDSFSAISIGLSEDAKDIFLLDLMANDLGGNGKSLYSLDDSYSPAATSKTYAPADLLQQDAIGAVNYSKYGAEITITADGKVGYNTNTTAFSSNFQSLAAGEIGHDEFTYAIQLGDGTLSWATATLEIAGVNDAPVVAHPLTSETDEDQQPYTINLLTGASDVDDGHVLHAGQVTEANGKGGWTVDGDSITINPDFYNSLNDGDVETLNLNYQVIDEHGASADQTLTVTIEGITDAPSIEVKTSAGNKANELYLTITSLPAGNERVGLTFDNLPEGAHIFDQDSKDITSGIPDYCGPAYGGTEKFTLVLPENTDVDTDLMVNVTGFWDDGSVLGPNAQSVDLLYDVASVTEDISFSSSNQNIWGDFNGYVGWHEYIPFIGGAPVEWNAQDEVWTDVAGGGDYWHSGEFTLADVNLSTEDIDAVVRAPLDLAIAGQTEAANLVTAAKTWDTNAGAKYTMVNNVVNAWAAYDVSNAGYVVAKTAYDGAKVVFDAAQDVFDGAKGAFDWLLNEYTSLQNQRVAAYNDYYSSGVTILGVWFGDPIKLAEAVAVQIAEDAAWLAYEAGMPIYNAALSVYNGAESVFAPIEQEFNNWNASNKAAHTSAINLENALHNAGYYTDHSHLALIPDVVAAFAEHGAAELAVVGAEADKLITDGLVATAQVAYNLAHEALAAVDFGAELQVQADLFAQAGLQVDMVLDAGSVDTQINYQLTSQTQYNQTTDMLAITPLMKNMTSGDTVAFDTISPNVKFHAAIFYDVGADLDLTVDGNLNVAGQTILDLTPGTTAPLHISTTISTSSIPELPEGVLTSPVLEMIKNMNPGELELIDFDSARDLAGPFEVPGINYLMGLVGADDILTVELAFPTVQTEGVSEAYSQDYFKEGGLVGVDFSEITDSLFNTLHAKIDYSPEMKELANISGSLLDGQTFDQLVNNALKAFSATILDTLDGQSESVPVFLIDATDETSTSLLHVNTFPDNLSTVKADTASFGFFAGYGESEPVVKVSVDLDQAYYFIVNEVVKAIVDALAAGTTYAATNAIPTINPYDLSLGMNEICEAFELPKEIADVINFEIGFQAADLDVHDAVNFSQEFSLSIDDMSYLVTLEDGFKSSFIANGTGNMQIENASSHDANHDGVIGYSLDIVPTAMFSNDTEIGLSMGYVFDLLKGELSAGVTLPLADLLNIPGLGDISIPGIDINLGPLLRVQGDLDLVDVDVYETRFAINAGSDSVTGGVDINLIGIENSTSVAIA